MFSCQNYSKCLCILKKKIKTFIILFIHLMKILKFLSTKMKLKQQLNYIIKAKIYNIIMINGYTTFIYIIKFMIISYC